MTHYTCLSKLKHFIISKIYRKTYKDRIIKLILDRSGSMISMDNEAIKGTINFLNEEMKNSKGKYNVDIEIISFDEKNETLFTGNIDLIDNKKIEYIKKE